MTFLTFIRHPEVKRELWACAKLTAVFAVFFIWVCTITPGEPQQSYIGETK